MNSKICKLALLLTFALSPFVSCEPAVAQSDAGELQPFFDTNTVGFLHINIQEFDFKPGFDLLMSNDEFVSAWAGATAQRQMLAMLPMLEGYFEQIRNAGAKDGIACFNLTNPAATSILVPTSNLEDAEKLLAACPMGSELIGNTVVIGMPGAAQTIVDGGLPARDDVQELLQLAEGHMLTLVISPTSGYSFYIPPYNPFPYIMAQ